MQTLTLFVSSPGDVRDERQAVGRIVERLQARYWNFIRLEPVLWEKEPLRATAHFNEELIRPSDCDLFVCILWSRLGSPLPSQFNRKDGSRFDSGTEWELEEATEAYEERAATDGEKAHPDILVYRRMSEPPAGDPDQVNARAVQRKLLDTFCQRFFFNEDGTIRRAFSPYETVEEFTTLFEQHLEKLLLRHIRLQRGLAESAVRPLPLEGSPFKGLGAFDFEDAPLFFGRNRAITEALDQLKRNHEAGHAFLLIYGGSGYGKSSLMRAGIAPRLTAEGYLPDTGAWRRATLLPVIGDTPAVETLARTLVAALPELEKLPDPWDSARLARQLSTPGELPLAIAAIVAALDHVSAAHPSPLLLMIDQLEEIFTAASIHPVDRDAFFNALAALAMSPRIWILATMRSEFFPRIPEHQDLFQLVRHGGGYILGPPQLPELHQIIRYPALAAGLQFERHPETGRDLSEQIYQDAAHAQDALPLLEFTLEELYQRRRENLLTWSSYEDLGGLAGAIARRAQETFDALPSETRREAARHLFGELVTLDTAHESPATRRRALRDTLHDAHPGAPAFLEAFIDAKLLVTGSENAAATVTLAHEALITHWPVLKDWIDDHRDLLLARRRLEDAARLWTAGHRSPKYLLTEGRLAEAQRVEESRVFRLSPDETELIRLSRHRARRKLRFFQAATALFALLAVAAGILGLVARQRQQQALAAEQKALLSERQAHDSAAETRRTLAAADFDAGAARIADGAPDEALPHLLAALESDPQNLDAQALLLETLRRTAWHFPDIQIKSPLPIRALSFGADPDTLFVATDSSSSGEGFNTTLRWNLQDLSIESLLAPRYGQITQTLSISPSAKHALIQRDYKWIGPTYLCDAQTLRIIASLPVSLTHKVPSTCFAWSPDGLLLAYPAKVENSGPARSPFTWRIIDAATSHTVRESDPFPADAAPWLAAHLDRTRLRAIAADGSLFEIPLHPEAPILTGPITGNQARPFDFALFSPDGNQLLSLASADEYDPAHYVALQIVLREGENSLSANYIDLSETASWTNARSLAERFPWTNWESPAWKRMLGLAPGLPAVFQARGSRLAPAFGDSTRRDPVAPVHADSQIESAALSGNRLVVGSASGLLHIREILPPIGHNLSGQTEPTGEDDTETDNHGWATVHTVDRATLQHRGRDWRLLHRQDKRTVPLQPHINWNLTADIALSTDASLVVLAGYSSGSGGYSSAGMILCDPATGAHLTDIEPVTEIRGVCFLGDTHRLAAIGSTEILIADVAPDGFRRVAAIPAVDALSIHYLSSRNLLAIATAREVAILDTRDFSRIAELPLEPLPSGRDGGWEKTAHTWLFDDTRNWLAYRHDGKLHLWSLASRRPLISALPVPSGPMTFAEANGFIGLQWNSELGTRNSESTQEGHGRPARESTHQPAPQNPESFRVPGSEFLVLAKQGLTEPKLIALRSLSETLSGARFAPGTRSLVTLPAAERRGLAASIDPATLDSLLPGTRPALDRIAALAPREAEPAAWLPVWERLAAGSGGADPSIARWASSLGPDHPWFQTCLRGLIARSDRTLYRLLHEKRFPDDEPLPSDPDIAHLHRLAGDSADLGRLKQAAWLAFRTDPDIAGKALAGEMTAEDFPEIDLPSVAKLELAALDALREALTAAEQSDWRLILLDELRQRPAALELLDAHIVATEKSHPLAHAEALALRGRLADAEAFLKDKLPADTSLTLAQAHFLLASGIAHLAPEAIDRALDAHRSPWLWSAWLDHAIPETLPARVERTMNAVEGRGPAAIAALDLALRDENAPAIDSALKLAKDLPSPVRDYAAARILWLEGRKPEVFALWPGDFPNYLELSESSDMLGWEGILLGAHADAFLDLLRAELSALFLKPDATLEETRAHAARLLDPVTAATFGAKRLHGPSLQTALALSRDADSAGLVAQLVERARLTGAPPADCLRAEALSLMAQGEFTAAYARWLQLVDTDSAQLQPADYLEASRCLLEDLQNEPAIQLLLRGKDHFPADGAYALEAAWLLLYSEHPEEAGVLLEHGFAIPFASDHQQTATALLVCAAELTGRTDRADQAFQNLLTLSPDWSDEEALQNLDWPETLKTALLAVAGRNQ